MFDDMTLGVIVAIFAISLVAEYFDSTFGMGYGTILTPVMLLFGFKLIEVVPIILFSEFVTGLVAGYTHHSLGNVQLFPKTIHIWTVIRKLIQTKNREDFDEQIPRHLQVALVLSLCSVVGVLFSVWLAIKVPTFFLKLYIGILLISLGVVLLGTANRTFKFSWVRVMGLGLLASFNKGLSGGGYGPVVTGGQILVGVDSKNTVGITSLAEGITCGVGVLFYMLAGKSVNWSLTLVIMAGSIAAIPLCAIAVRSIPVRYFRKGIAISTLVLGIFTLSK